MVDVNMARLIERLYGQRTLADIRYDPHVNGTAHRLIQLATRPKEFNWAVLDLGAAHCKARSPLCLGCPLLVPLHRGYDRLKINNLDSDRRSLTASHPVKITAQSL